MTPEPQWPWAESGWVTDGGAGSRRKPAGSHGKGALIQEGIPLWGMDVLNHRTQCEKICPQALKMSVWKDFPAAAGTPLVLLWSGLVGTSLNG